MELTGRTVLVVGFGLKTGVSAVKFLSARGARTIACDDRSAAELAPSLAAVAGLPCELLAGGIPVQVPEGVDFLLLSPGVPRSIRLVHDALARGMEVIGDIELAWRCLPYRFAAITGTDGKSTTTALVGAVLSRGGYGTIGGNIGVPVLELADSLPEDRIVALELSSFQLESIGGFHPQAAVVLNVAPDHLDRYPSFDDYLSAKLAIFRNQTAGDTALIPLDSPYRARLEKAVPANCRILTFSLDDPGADACLRDGMLTVEGETVVAVSELRLRGRHNHANALVAAALCRALGLPTDAIRAGLAGFPGLAHRFEFVAERDGIEFINDSKATTIQSVATAVSSAKTRACLLLGGRDKGLDFSSLVKGLQEKEIAVFSFGEAAEKIAAAVPVVARHAGLAEAFRAAAQCAGRENRPQVILSPGCTSYDAFENFEERGECFRSLATGEAT
jgi:UDP-N-acetylmuramoylalanine--D-glutamate ligase